MRPSSFFALLVAGFILFDLLLVFHVSQKNHPLPEETVAGLVSSLGLSDLCISTEARYIRHLAISDKTAPFMDHPGGLEHFPSGSFFGVGHP